MEMSGGMRLRSLQLGRLMLSGVSSNQLRPWLILRTSETSAHDGGNTQRKLSSEETALSQMLDADHGHALNCPIDNGRHDRLRMGEGGMWRGWM